MAYDLKYPNCDLTKNTTALGRPFFTWYLRTGRVQTNVQVDHDWGVVCQYNTSSSSFSKYLLGNW